MEQLVSLIEQKDDVGNLYSTEANELVNKSLSMFLAIAKKQHDFSEYVKFIPDELLNDEVLSVLIESYNKKTNNSEDEYEIRYIFVNLKETRVLKNPILIRKLLNNNFDSSLINYVSEDILRANPDIIDLAITKGYILSDNTPQSVLHPEIVIKIIEHHKNSEDLISNTITQKINL